MDLNIEHLLHLALDSGGVLFVMPLLLLVALAVVIERTWALARCERDGLRALATIERLRHMDRGELAKLAAGIPAPFATVVGVPVRFKRVHDERRLESLIEESILRLVPGLDRRLWVLDTVVTLAPLLGLLGTIVGMFHAFSILGQAGGAPTQITGGVAEALTATAAGLFIAIVGLIGYNALQERVRRLVHHMETLKSMLVNRLEGAEDRSGESAAAERLHDPAVTHPAEPRYRPAASTN